MTRNTITVADEVWLATAALHEENPGRPDFTMDEIVQRVQALNLYGRLRPGVRVHASLHCVANKKPNPGNHCMLVATGRSRRRLFRTGDDRHPDRVGKRTPHPADVPATLQHLLTWYRQVYDVQAAAPRSEDPILAARGLGREVWQGKDPDRHVEELRAGWE